MRKAGTFVLIETYWNVKKPDSEPKLDSESNINRNILECKVLITTFFAAFLQVLIETYWNVKSSPPTFTTARVWY